MSLNRSGTTHLYQESSLAPSRVGSHAAYIYMYIYPYLSVYLYPAICIEISICISIDLDLEPHLRRKTTLAQ